MKIDKIYNQTFQSHTINSKEITALKTAISKKKVFLYDVDTTHGFMDQEILRRKDGVTDGFPVIGSSVPPA